MKKIPERTCVITKEKYPKKELIRVVRNKEGEVFASLNYKFADRKSEKNRVQNTLRPPATVGSIILN